MFKIKVLILALLLSIAFTVNISADNTIIKDIDESAEYARKSIESLAQSNIITGDENGKFNPQKKITRVEIITLLVRVLELDTSITPEAATFKDVPKDHWANKYVEAAYKEGITNGIEADRFGLDEVCTREQLAAMLVRALKLLDNKTSLELSNVNSLLDKQMISSWAVDSVEIAMKSGLINGIEPNVFGSKQLADKQQAAVVLDRFIKNKDNIKNIISNNKDNAKIIINGMAASFDNNIIIEGNNFLVPLNFYKRYFTNQAEIPYIWDDISIIIEEGDMKWNLLPDFVMNDFRAIWLRIGSDISYRDVMENPFVQNVINKENFKVQLKDAPRIIDGEAYLSLDAWCSLLNVQYAYDETTNIISINDSRIKKYPELYGALRKNMYPAYKGKIDINMQYNEKAVGSNEYANYNYDYTANINNHNSYIKGSYILEGSGFETLNGEIEELIEPGILYKKDNNDNKWIKYLKDHPVNHIDGALIDPVIGDFTTNKLLTNESIFTNYSKLPVNKVSSKIIDGELIEKYVIELDANTMKSFLSSEHKANLDYVFRKSAKYRIEYTMKNSNITEQSYWFSGTAYNETGSYAVKIDMNLKMEFFEIGEKQETPDPSMLPIKSTIYE